METHHPFDLHSRLTPKDLASLEVDLWQPPTISDAGHLVYATPRAASKAPAIEDENEISKKEGYKAGFEEGKLEGVAQGKAEGINLGKQEGLAVAGKEQQPKLAELNRLLTTLSHTLNEEDYKLEKTLFDLVKAIAQEVIRKELELNPASLMKVVKEIVNALPPSRDNIKITLNPLDKVFVDEAVSQGGENWHVVADEEISPGGCLVSTDSSEADGSVEKRVKAVLDQMYENQAVCPKPGDSNYEEAPEPAVSSAPTQTTVDDTDTDTDTDADAEQEDLE